MITLTLLPENQTIEAEAGERILDILLRAGIRVKAECGGRGKCGGCRVLFNAADVTPETLSDPGEDEEKLLPQKKKEMFFRVACATRVYKDATLTIPEDTRISEVSVRKPVTRYKISIDPAVKKVTVDLARTDDEKPDRSLRQKIELALREKTGHPLEKPSLAVMAELSRSAHQDVYNEMTAVVYKDKDILQIRPGTNPDLFGFALDIGTTSLGAYLCDLVNDRIVSVASLLNPQVTYGEDVISRIAHVRKSPHELAVLQNVLIDGINGLIEKTTAEAGLSSNDLVDVVVVGNPTMQHLFLGLHPGSLGEAPYLPQSFEGGDTRACDLGLKTYPLANVHVLPMLSGFIGGDTLAAMLTRSSEDYVGNTLLVDVGTNGELVLVRDGKMFATSCATGPVFEGAQIHCGMRATPGAIDRVWMDDKNGSIQFHVIGRKGEKHTGEKPAGICGSGVISAVSTLLHAGIISRDGAFNLESGHPALRKNPHSGRMEAAISPASETRTGEDIVFTQQDVRAVQLGKGALRAGIEILMKEARVSRLDRIFLAGTFGSYLDPLEVLHLGMVPQLDLEQIVSIGNAAGDGARLALFSLKKREEALSLAKQIKVLELSMRPDFQEVFVDALHF